MSLNQEFMLFGGNIKEYSFFRHGFKIGNQSGIKCINFGENEEMTDFKDVKSDDRMTFHKDSYITIELPYIKDKDGRFNHHALVFGGK